VASYDALGSAAIIGNSLADFKKFIEISTEWLIRSHGMLDNRGTRGYLTPLMHFPELDLRQVPVDPPCGLKSPDLTRYHRNTPANRRIFCV
jgi:hypothetical protein